MTITYVSYVGEDQIRTSGIVSELLERRMHFLSAKGDIDAGLLHAYRQLIDEDECIFTHIWVALSDQKIMGVCVLTDAFEDQMHVYVRMPWRKHGVGSALVKMAVDTGRSFGAWYTPKSANIYRRHGLVNLRHKK